MADECTTDCDEVLRQLELYLDGEGPGDLRTFVEAHLGGCSPCMGRAAFEQRVRELVAHACRDRAPVGLVDRVLARLVDAEPV